ncbi:hypothetical protein MMC30_007020 [Trapelia coarctata]|nr:hypothetical protein [Trapelia coarctata]
MFRSTIKKVATISIKIDSWERKLLRRDKIKPNRDPSMNPRATTWFEHYYQPLGHPVVREKEKAMTKLSPVARGLSGKWNQLCVVLEMLDDHSFLFWWSKDCPRHDRKLFRREVESALKLIGGYLRDQNICEDLDDAGVGRRLHNELGRKIYARIVAPLHESSNFDDHCADFKVLARELNRIKMEIRLLVEEALLREKIRTGWHLVLGGNL